MTSRAVQVNVEGWENIDDVYVEIQTDWNDYSYFDVTLDAIQQEMAIEHASFFNNAKAPNGDPWAPLKPATVKRKGHDKILYDTGALQRSLVTKTTESVRDQWDEPNNHGISYGTRLEYAVFHQDGTTKLPKREHVGMTDKLLEDILEMVADRAVEILEQNR